MSSDVQTRQHEAKKMECDRLIKLENVIGNPRKGIAGLIPISKAGWYAGVASGLYPKPVKLGASSFWRLSDVLRLVNGE